MDTNTNVRGFYIHIYTHSRERHTWHSISQKLDSSSLLGKTYPVGSLYMSTAATSPASLFGGTWERIQDKFLLAAGSSYAVGATGGAASVSLTQEQLPKHTHWMGVYTTTSGSDKIPGWTLYVQSRWDTSSNWASTSADEKANCKWGETGLGTTSSTGSGTAHDNMPPYIAVYVWKRTA